MPTPASGAIGFYAIGQATLQSSYVGSPTSNIGMNIMYKGGTLFPAMGVANNISPTSGTIAAANMYGVYGFRTLGLTMTVGALNYVAANKVTYTLYGFSLTSLVLSGKSYVRGNDTTHNYFNWPYSAFGSISANTYTTYYGTQTIVGISWDSGSGHWSFDIYSSGGGADSNNFIVQVVVSGYVTMVRSSRLTYAIATNSIHNSFNLASHPTSGSVAVTFYYYG